VRLFENNTTEGTKMGFVNFVLTFHGKILLFGEFLVNSPSEFIRNIKNNYGKATSGGSESCQ
jgi:hypothetical protein